MKHQIRKNVLSFGFLVFVVSISLAFQQGSKVSPIKGPRRTVLVEAFQIKLSDGTSSGFSFGGGSNNSSVSGEALDGTIKITDPGPYTDGMAQVLVTDLVNSQGFIVVENTVTTGTVDTTGSFSTLPPPVAESSEALKKAQFSVKAVITEISCRKRSGGISLGGFGAGQGQYENKVVIDIRLIDNSSGQVVEAVRATGKKSTKSSIFSVEKFDNGSNYLSGPVKILDLKFADFKETPLYEASRNATAEVVKALLEKLSKRTWEARVMKVVKSDSTFDFYLNVDSECGLKEGDKLEIVILGDPILDNKTGKLAGRTKPTKIAEVSVSYLSDDNVAVSCSLDAISSEIQNKLGEDVELVARLKK